jgi:DNA-directed RNA polymerase specialized sigma24 family protein
VKESLMDSYFPNHEPEPELASDLEWMLQTSHAPLPVLAAALVEEFYPPVYRLALALLHEPEQARRVLPDLFSAALQQRHRFTGSEPIPVWLFQVVLEHLLSRSPTRFLRAVPQRLRHTVRSTPHLPQPEHPTEAALWACIDRLPLPSRALLVLTQVLEWDVTEAGQALHLEPEQAGTLLLQARGRCTAASAWEGVPGEAPVRSPEWLKESLHRRWPAPEVLAPEAQTALAALSAARAERQTQGSRRASLVKEVGLVALTVALVGGALWGMSQLDPQPPLEEGLFLTHTTRPTGTREPTPSPTRPYYSEPFPQGVFYTVLPGDTWEQAAARLGTTAAELLRLNRIPPGAPPIIGQRLLIPGKLTPRAATPVEASFFSPTPAPPVNPEASFTEAAERMYSSLFENRSLWLDYQVQVFGLPGITAPPAVYQGQMWMASQGERMAVAGSREGDLPSVIMSEGLMLNAQSPPGSPWFREMTENDIPGQVQGLFRLYQMVFFPYNWQPECMQNLGIEAGNESGALILFQCRQEEEGEETRIWIDIATGLPMRQQFLLDEQLVRETRITGYETNFPYPFEMLDPWLPWRGGYARNGAGDPLPYATPSPASTPQSGYIRPLRTPSPGFDPSQSELALEYRDAPDWMSGASIQQGQPARLFAGDILLLEADFPEPHSLACYRSPEGDSLVFASRTGTLWGYAAHHYQNIRWLNLSHPIELRPLEPDLTASALAYAPDGKTLAVAALSGDIFLLDLESGELRSLAKRWSTTRLAWSPAGDLLAVTVQPEYEKESQTFVYAVESGKQLTLADAESQVGAPVNEWVHPPEAGSQWCRLK